MRTERENQLVIGLDFYKDNAYHKSRIDGIRQYARLRGWALEFFSPQELPPAAIRPFLARRRPVGCLVECSRPLTAPPYEMPTPGFFGETPVVYIDPQTSRDRSLIRNASALFCDNAAVAEMAFRELSANNPPSYAAVPYLKRTKWSRERIDAFCALCAGQGKECRVFPCRHGEKPEEQENRLVGWLAGLPRNCAVFSVNDGTAWRVACAFRAAGRHVPRSATLVGVDGFDQWPDEMPLRISSVKLGFGRAGFLAARLLAERIAGGPCFVVAADGTKPVPPATFGPLCVLRRESTRGRGRRDPRILEAAEIIQREADEGLNVAALAKRFGCSRRLFEIRFREAMGHSPLDEIRHVRLEHAQAMLLRGDVPIAAVADFCGFGTVRQMHRVFRASTGKSPREWRKANSL